MSRNKRKLCSAGFTLIELLIVIVILGILATIGLTFFTSAQMRGRDTKRKNDLKQVATALELYYSDYSVYPTASVDGKINGCPSTTPTSCSWDGKTSEFTDGKTMYMKMVPADPSSSNGYYYRTVTVDSVANQGYQLFAALENSQDQSRISTAYSCGANTCNFSITSANVTPAQ